MGNFAFSVSAQCLGRCRYSSWYLERISDIERSFRPNRNRSSHFPAWFFIISWYLFQVETFGTGPKEFRPILRREVEQLLEIHLRAKSEKPWARKLEFGRPDQDLLVGQKTSFHFFVTNASCHLQLRFFLYKRHNDLMPTTTSLKSHSHSHIFNVSRYIYAIERWVTCTCLKKAIFLSLSS